MKFMKKAVPHTIAGIIKAPINICLIHLLPVLFRQHETVRNFQEQFRENIKLIVCVGEKENLMRKHSFITSLFCIQASPKVTIDRGGGSVHKNGCAQHGSSPAEKTMWVESCEVSELGLYSPSNWHFIFMNSVFLHSCLIILLRCSSIECFNFHTANFSNTIACFLYKSTTFLPSFSPRPCLFWGFLQLYIHNFSYNSFVNPIFYPHNYIGLEFNSILKNLN